jgi:hypothetical protein
MTKKRKENDQGRWRGAAVEAQPGDQAERAAERVEGNEPVRADAEAERLHHQSDLEAADGQGRAAPAGTNPDDETEDAAEEHRDRQAAEGYPPRGKL